MRALRVVETTGTALQLQLCFVVLALPVVTILPAAITLQRQWQRYRRGEQTTVLSFVRQFARVLRGSWLPGLLFGMIVMAFVVSIAFWSSTEGRGGSLALGGLLGLGLVALGYYLALLAASVRTESLSWGQWSAAAVEALLSSLPRFVLAGAVVVVMWIVISYLPPIALVSVGIVPTLVASWAGRVDHARRS